MKSTIKLFKAIPISEKKTANISASLLRETIRRGFIFSPEIAWNYTESELVELIETIENEIGLTPEQMNNSFQKDWTKIKTANIYQLAVEQIIHYITTYGFERFGIYSDDTIYIPIANLDIPEITKDIPLIIIKGYTIQELKEKVLTLLKTGVALAKDTVKDITELAIYVEIEKDTIYDIKNKEVRAALYEHFGLVPKDPIEFLRYIVFKTTDKTLLIKNPATCEEIKTAVISKPEIVRAFRIYQRRNGLHELAKIFYRFKPLFLAFRANDELKPIVNRIRRLATTYHEPLKKDYLNEVTAILRKYEIIKIPKLKTELARVSIFRKIRLAQALNYRTGNDLKSIVYKIRNGKAYATEFNIGNQPQIKRALTVVINSIINDLEPKVTGKKIFIPKGINYAMPATEKQFTGHIPNGTYITLNSDMVFGIHWENIKRQRIDIDLSLIDANATKIGWNGIYRSEGETILFSGDLTSAPLPNGASELFYVHKNEETHYILLANYYNFNKDIDVPFKILVAEEPTTKFKQNHMVNPNNIRCITTSKMDIKEKILGLLVTSPTECKFYFNESNLGKGITSSSSNTQTQHARQYLFDYSMNSISLNDILENAGAILINTKEKADIDLSPENLEKDTIINLLA